MLLSFSMQSLLEAFSMIKVMFDPCPYRWERNNLIAYLDRFSAQSASGQSTIFYDLVEDAHLHYIDVEARHLNLPSFWSRSVKVQSQNPFHKLTVYSLSSISE